MNCWCIFISIHIRVRFHVGCIFIVMVVVPVVVVPVVVVPVVVVPVVVVVVGSSTGGSSSSVVPFLVESVVGRI